MEREQKKRHKEELNRFCGHSNGQFAEIEDLQDDPFDDPLELQKWADLCSQSSTIFHEREEDKKLRTEEQQRRDAEEKRLVDKLIYGPIMADAIYESNLLKIEENRRRRAKQQQIKCDTLYSSEALFLMQEEEAILRSKYEEDTRRREQERFLKFSCDIFENANNEWTYDVFQ